MHFTSVALLGAAFQLAAAYPITGSTVNCRSGPSTNDKVIKTYSRDHQVTVSCQVTGESVSGNNIWDMTSDKCYVADYYVKTGSNKMVTNSCKPSGGGGGDDGGSSGGHSSVGGSISRKEIIDRGQFWIKKHMPYSMYDNAPDQQGRDYRTDCSGFVSMALHASQSYSTVTLPEIGKAIAWNDIKPGDFVGTLGAGTGMAGGHVTLFLSWADSGHKVYNTLECKGKQWGCIADKRDVGWTDNGRTAKPYRYNHVSD